MGQILGLLQQIFSVQAWAQLFSDLAVLLQGINQIKAGGNTIQTEVSVVQANQATAATALTTGVNDILTAIALAQQTGHVVTLPAVAPTGYGGASANDVWDYVPVGLTVPTSYLMSTAGRFPEWFRANTVSAVPTVSNAEGWLLTGDFANATDTQPSWAGLVPVQLNSILLTDATYSDWLTRVTAGMAFTLDQGRAYYWPGSGDWYWYCAYSTSDFTVYQATVLGLGAHHASGPPVWPGLALVTLGTPVALSEALTVAELMDGVIIELTSIPSQRGFYGYDDIRVYQNVGALVFVSDHGDVETYQAIGGTYAVYSPRSMVRASAVKIRGGPGVSGTVTPWLITT